MKKKKAIIIGAGLGGLALSVRLAKLGWDVSVFDQASSPGGKLSQKVIGKYRFDLGPSLFTMPMLVEELFTLCGEQPSDHFHYRKLEDVCHYFFSDGTSFVANANREKFAESCERVFGVDNRTIIRHFQYIENIHDLTGPVFLEQSLHRSSTYMSKAFLRAVMRIYQLPLLGSMHKAHRKRLQDPRLVQLFDRFATYNGSDPYRAPAMMQLIPHLEHGIGAYLPVGGMYAISKSVFELAQRQGVKFHFNEAVKRITHQAQHVTGIQTASSNYNADIVVSNMDMHPTYEQLLPDVEAPKKLLEQEKSSSALIFYWGVKIKTPQLGVHNILFSHNYEEEFEFLFKHRKIYHDPTVYINITSKLESEDAPPGCENWFVLINTPNHDGQNWSEWQSDIKAAVLRKIQSALNIDLQAYIEEEEILTPQMIESRTSSFRGSLYGNASNSTFAAFLRHPNFSNRLKGLYFCGGSVHPGGGIPLVLRSAAITAKEIKRLNVQ